jgi:hypothetical protein
LSNATFVRTRFTIQKSELESLFWSGMKAGAELVLAINLAAF